MLIPIYINRYNYVFTMRVVVKWLYSDSSGLKQVNIM